jgi:hypothetical membrane protein
VVLTAASVTAALVYTGTEGEGFSPLNHWVSELGQMGVSELALLFNIGLIVSGVCFAVFMLALGRIRRAWLKWLYVPIGVVAGIGGAFVGIFPMDIRTPHIISALTFFVLGWMCVGLASFDLWRRPDPRFPRWLPLLGGLTVAAFLIFLSLYVPYLTYTGAGSPDRPQFMLVVIFEWLVLVGIIGWVFVGSLYWWRARSGDRNAD